MKNDEEGRDILKAWYDSVDEFPEELGVYKNRHSQGLNRCFDTAVREKYQSKIAYGPPEFFTGPRAKLVEHNWFKKQDKILPDLKERLLQRVQAKLDCIVCHENFGEALEKIEFTYFDA